MAGRALLAQADSGFCACWLRKTTLVAQWLRSLGCAYTWLSVDEEHNDPARFLRYVLAALQQIDVDTGRAAQAMLQSPQPTPPDVLLTSLINDLAAIPKPFVLVLDDYHLIHTLAVHTALAFLTEHQPPQMHLVIATREDPPMPLARLRARAQAVDLRQADLRFTESETADFLRQVMGLEVSAAEAAILHQRTEGWVAGLQLAALSMRDREGLHQSVQSLDGNQRFILDCLIEEVFQRQTPDIQGFLLDTSILSRLTAPLCDADTSRHDSRHILGSLEKANLFVVPLDGSRQWYRYHTLFADLLRHRLQTEAGERAPDLHRRASQWYATNSFLTDAIRHALAAADWGAAAELFLRVSSDMMNRVRS